MTARQLQTRHGTVTFPTFMPVTTFGGKYPLDDLVRPYLRRFAQCVMVSYHYAKQMKQHERPHPPLFVDSGGFASLFEGSEIVDEGDYASIRTKEGDVISPPAVLAFQERHADIGATLDFIIPPGMDLDQSRFRQAMSIKNAAWALRNREREDLRLFASIQAWDPDSARDAMTKLASNPFDGFALGGMVPRVQNPNTILEIVRSLRQVESKRPLHVFGIGHPSLITRLFCAGVASTDSSSQVRAAVDKKYLLNSEERYISARDISHLPESCDCPVCSRLGTVYQDQRGELNTFGLALHNLTASIRLMKSQ